MEWCYTQSESSMLWKWGQYQMKHSWIALRTRWESKVVKASSVWNEQVMEWDYAQAEGLKVSIRQYDVSIEWEFLCNLITHALRGQNKVSIERKAHQMALRTRWEFRVIKKRSTLHENFTEWPYDAPAKSSKGLKRNQYWMKNSQNDITHDLVVQRDRQWISIQ